MKFLRRLCALIAGSVFFIAGLFKLMDPVGGGLVVEEYLKFLNLYFLLPASVWLSEGVALVETVTGAALITGVSKKLFNWIAGAMIVFFTFLTALLWIKNPPMDCGCFGEALHLTHAQSFWKNIVLLALWAVASFPLSSQYGARRMKSVAFSLTLASVLAFSVYELFRLPLDDFTDLAPGAELMKEGEEAYGDVLLSFYDMDGEYRNELLTDYRAVAFSVYDPSAMTEKRWERISGLRNSLPEGLRPVLLLASTPSAAAETVPAGLLDICYFADRRTLMTLNRSNGGAAMIFRGYVVAKWSTHSYPGAGELAQLCSGNETEAMMTFTNASRLKLQGFLLYVFAVMLLL